MESARTFLFILFAFLTFLLYQAWQEDHKPEPVSKPSIESSVDVYQSEQAIPSASPNNADDLSAEIPQEPGKTNPSVEVSVSTQPIEVITDTLKVLISPNGGNLVSAELLNYKMSLDENSPPINILENRDGRIFLALSGLFGTGAPDFNKNVANYHSAQNHYELDGKESINVDLTWVNANGVEYIKRFTFHKGQYVVDVKFLVNNKSSERIANRMFTALQRDQLPADGQESVGIGMQSYLGPAYSTQESKYEKYDFDDLAESDLSAQTQGGWIAILQHYFVTAWVPEGESKSINKIDATSKNLRKAGLSQIRITQDWVWIDPDQSVEFAAKLYVGPKIQADLEKLSEGLELTVDYGFLWWIGQPIFYMLIFFQGFVINWGAAIILVTIAIKMLLYPLARAQYRSFAKMRLLQPKMTAMKERYGDDRQQMSMKMMELYKKEKVNPLGGCFPLLIQMPVFIALYWVLMESVELRHAPFILWINDLAVKDPYYILPLLMGASMYLMQKMQPTSPTMDPMQQKMLQMMPVFMTIFFVFFPAGLVLYWLMNNLISIAQQLYITNQFNKEQEAKNK
ncbi:membrane protein insertase YidC [Aliikangiella coralliicola]|uniref:Membrane protein insertase YidC n=1 Tax=Aliikangiella coralliicola TaxID=2592383 RepID=A0A545UGJ6_9GAMM|nr:membrane protein insertase YidC [Aliikangiella coralliicola]TQV88596.1 membrane protein insertase YidC [Aliikangiella coralliicola]